MQTRLLFNQPVFLWLPQLRSDHPLVSGKSFRTAAARFVTSDTLPSQHPANSVRALKTTLRHC